MGQPPKAEQNFKLFLEEQLLKDIVVEMKGINCRRPEYRS